jgi:biopolymer transport protein ExbD
MSFGNSEDFFHNQPLSEINMIPLIDIMLVLLILFIITAPFFIPHAVKIDIPQATNQPANAKPQTIILALDEKGTLFWNEKLVNFDELKSKLELLARQNPLTEIHVYADKQTRYQKLAETLAAIQNAGITQVGLMTQPK